MHVNSRDRVDKNCIILKQLTTMHCDGRHTQTQQEQLPGKLPVRSPPIFGALGKMKMSTESGKKDHYKIRHNQNILLISYL